MKIQKEIAVNVIESSDGFVMQGVNLSGVIVQGDTLPETTKRFLKAYKAYLTMLQEGAEVKIYKHVRI